jgi:hypothetical protein
LTKDERTANLTRDHQYDERTDPHQRGHSALTRAFPTVPPETIAEVIHDVHVKFDGAPLREFVPLFVERRARSALDQLSVSYQS